MNLVCNQIKNLTEKKYVLFTSNCSTAIYLLLKSLNLKNKKIIVPVNLCYDVILSIISSRNIPIIIDTNDNLGFSLKDLKDKLEYEKDIKVIIFPYLYGNSDNFKSVLKLAKKNQIIQIEDIAGSLGGKIKQKYFGSFGDFTVGSFGKGKIIDMSGGGFIATNNRDVFLKVRRNYKSLSKFQPKNKLIYLKSSEFLERILKTKKKNLFTQSKIKHFSKGFIYYKKFNKKFYFDLFQKIKKIDLINRLRNNNSKFYEKIFKFDILKPITHEKGSVYWRKNFILKKGSSEKLIKYLNQNNFYSRKYYPPLNHIFPIYKKKMANYEKNYKKLINFWVGEELNKSNILRARKNIINFFNEKNKL